ncbi:TPA: gp58-like family protein [Streptococcus pyogenes]|uniref:gp58-like family protein n=2 Tax=Streptococcus pyogenes TaxID=1314 RepID=UPI00004023ED|nr:gp58-like family protein [Streptococcus pyogenes]QBX28708.1 hyaluronidase [Streptococcus phage Javan460]HEP6153516.1 gp58-like family protein [Streptococcus pyogenes ABC020047615]HEP6281526.1 gp58-like family protein [Streptococcus pyogenes ABC020055734]HEP6296395.1 gp58-like family protein [Streptococcus pyogenes ABC020035251]HEP6328009.1 gp58-like family protein [Streptococcus pyogenes ABC020033513]HEQ1609683.1 gp58-like family protein [Streptococcus pyogenes ABC020061669]HER4598915.1 g
MSRDPTLTLDESNLVIGKDGRVHYTFTAEDDNPKVRLASKCLGTAHFNQLMIERGDKPTNYVAPVVVEGTGNPTGLFKDLKELNLELTDTANSQLWAKIKLNNHGMLQTYFDTTIKNEILTTAQGIRETISDTERGLKSEFLRTVQGQRIQLKSLLEQKTAQLGLTVDGLKLDLNKANEQTASLQASINGLRQEYQDAERKLSASYQTGINGLKATMANDKYDLKAEIQATARGLSQEYDNKLHQLSAKIKTTSSGTTEAYENKLAGLRAEFTRSNQGTRTELESQISGLRAVQQTTASQISQEIRDRTGAVSRVQQDLESYQRRLQDAEDNYSSLTHTVRGLQSDVGSPTGKIQSRFTQLQYQIDQRVTRDGVMSIINQSGDSIKLAIQKAGGINAKMSGNEIISAINLNSYGVTIAGKHIALDGNTTVNGTFTTKIAEAIKIRADQIIAGTLDASKARIINLNASSIVGLDANFIKAKIGYAIVDMLEGKVIKARNSAMLIDLSSAKMDFNSNATINFNSRDNALVRKDGTHTAFVHFSNATPKGYTGSALYASIGITSSGDGVNSASSGRFAGLRSFRYATGYNHTAAVDQTELYGDNVLIADDFSINRGFKFRPDKMEKVLDMNDLYAAVVALGRCWKHLANVGWNTVHGNFVSAVNGELNNYITKI